MIRIPSAPVRAAGPPGVDAGGDRGAAAAELAVVLPAVVLVLGFCLGAVQTVGQQVMLTSAAEEAARSLGRGEDAGTASGRIAGAAGDATMAVDRSGHAVCVRLTAPSRFGPAGAAGITVSARGCAWQEDQDAP
ncbi:TadE family type IV pilus minor pilin [Clavibacter zhangzhiyongii]|uniref:TadE family type IV pilus minor pilin n=1 Tax=Clavibacter zhangzhiyongii TaxID=2768071 RepID=UPI001FD2D02C|nr:TadE family type IV pilus minor pilin [Clavibacter zhangzhiyongii]